MLGALSDHVELPSSPCGRPLTRRGDFRSGAVLLDEHDTLASRAPPVLPQAEITAAPVIQPDQKML